MLVLDVKVRNDGESAEQLRARGTVPAVLYGPKESPIPIAVDELKLARVWKEAGETTVVTLRGIGEEKETLIYDAQFHPVTGRILHVDFYALEKGKKVTIKIPLEFVGIALAEKAGHVVVKTLHDIEIEVAPHKLPHSLTVDLSKLESAGDHIVAADILLPADATLVTNPSEIVASVKEFREEPSEIAPPPETEILTARQTEGKVSNGDSAEVSRKEGRE